MVKSFLWEEMEMEIKNLMNALHTIKINKF